MVRSRVSYCGWANKLVMATYFRDPLLTYKPSYIHGVGKEPLVALTLGQLIQNAADKWGEREAIYSVYEGKRYSFKEAQEEVIFIFVQKSMAVLLNAPLKGFVLQKVKQKYKVAHSTFSVQIYHIYNKIIYKIYNKIINKNINKLVLNIIYIYISYM